MSRVKSPIISCFKRLVADAAKRGDKKSRVDRDYMTWKNMITLLFIEQEGCCPSCGDVVEFEKGERLKNFNKASPDQIIAGKGYVRGNVRMVCFGCNSMKNNMSHAEFVRRCANVVYMDRKLRRIRGREKVRGTVRKTARRSHRAKVAGAKGR